MCEIKTKYKDYQTILINPFNGRKVNIDNCMINEIKQLWKQGIKTIECCCGHGEVKGYIAVKKEFIKTMEILNYEHRINELYPEAKEFFIPK